MSDDETDDGTPPLLGRLLFASGLAVLALRNLTNLDGRIDYAEYKGVPFPETLVPASSGLLLGGSLGIGLWKLPRLSAASVATFFLGVTPVMHDFWAVDADARDEELTSFLQNVTLLGAALVFLKRAAKE
ncbi:DoxX family membrane protein [Haloplanus natans]|uniref:DoxX family membrane protein n=1 Tax=Haloplanus natans TaxID=376171 RepID=UPI000677BA0C|nr:DoxX family membrane protein [Haloplanus natans]